MEYEQGSTPVFYVTFADYDGSQADVVSGTINIKHYYGANTTTDVDDQTLTQLYDSTYYYNGWNIPARADQTIYDVRYVAVYSDNSVVVGGIDFQVIPRRFYDRKGGGLVKNVSLKTIWTRKEKEALLKTIDQIGDMISRISGELELKADKSLSDELNVKFEEVNKHLTGLESLSDKTVMMDSINKLDNKIIEIREMVSDSTKDQEVKKVLKLTCSKLSEIKPEHYMDRLPTVIAQLDDVQHKINEFREFYKKSIPEKSLRRAIANES